MFMSNQGCFIKNLVIDTSEFIVKLVEYLLSVINVDFAMKIWEDDRGLVGLKGLYHGQT